jgi:serine/threonine protein kinase
MLTLNDLVMAEYNDHHKLFKEFLQYIFVIDPKHRPSATECLNHPFLSIDIPDHDIPNARINSIGLKPSHP